MCECMDKLDEIVGRATGRVGDPNDKAEVLGVFRRMAKLDPQDIAALLGVTPGCIVDIETGRKTVSDEVVMSIMMLCTARMTFDEAMQGNQEG